MKSLLFFILLLVSSLQSISQPRAVRKMPNPLNQSSFNSFAPYISFDGNAIIFLTDYSDDGTLVLYYSKRVAADWSAPIALPKTFYSFVNFVKGYTLSPDGQTLYLTRQGSNNIGGFDIYSCALKGNTFADPQNLGLPLNTKQHDAAPTLTPDNLTMYFMRCESMTSQQADRCKIMMSKKQPGGRWSEAQELPATINTGNSQTPRMMADGETLIFSSNKIQPNKGGMDLYESRWNGQTWSEPTPLEFVNTAQDDQFVSVTSQGQYLVRDTKTDRKTELTEYLFPASLKPKAILRVDGKLEDATIPSYVSIVNLTTSQRVYNGRPLADGSFTTFLAEGSRYEIAVEPENGNITFASRFFDLTKPMLRPFERYTVSLKPVADADELTLSPVTFKPYTSTVESTAQNELRRLSRLLKNNPSYKAEIQVLLQGYVEDTLQSDLDLTEIAIDTVEYYYDEIDSLGQLYQRDTTMIEMRYHNNRTEAQAKAIVEQLVALGCDRNSLLLFTNARPEAVLENRKTIVKAVLRRK
jgi:WD40-like Beta Propeller Repeat